VARGVGRGAFVAGALLSRAFAVDKRVALSRQPLGAQTTKKKRFHCFGGRCKLAETISGVKKIRDSLSGGAAAKMGAELQRRHLNSAPRRRNKVIIQHKPDHAAPR